MVRASGVTSAPKADRVFLLYVVILLVFGLASLISASAPLGYARAGDSFFFLKRQLLLGVIPGIILFLFCAKIDYAKWRTLGWLLYGLALLLLILVFIPGIGAVINHARSWVKLFGITFQPAELMKLSCIILLAHLLTHKKHDWNDWQGSLIPILAVLVPAVLLILLQPDLGTLSILLVTLFAILYLAKVPGRYLMMLAMIGLLSFIAMVFAAPYRMSRLTTFLHPELDPKGVGYQINQAYLAIGSGGFWGLGFGHSRQKFQYLPEVNADSIYAVIAEEDGFLMAGGLILLVILIAWRGFKIAKGAPDDFGYLLVAGIMVWLTWQSFLNIGAMVGALPLTGVPLPFVSHGGSALAVALGAIGVVANVSKRSRIIS